MSEQAAASGAGPSLAHDRDGSRSQACDPCKSRKTKCDRGSPCSSCVTAKLPCRTTAARPEKRQRILISARYDEALERVDHRLQEVLDTVRGIQSAGMPAPPPPPPSSQSQMLGGFAAQLLQHESDFPDGFGPGLLLPPDGAGSADRLYYGDDDPSFDAQVRRLAASGPLAGALGTGDDGRPRLSPPRRRQCRTAAVQQFPRPLLAQHPELVGHTALPPSEAVLGLLRLAQAEKQRFFVDVMHLDEQDLVAMCRDVFFAVHPYTISTWSVVNVALYFLFVGLSPGRCADLGLDRRAVDDIAELLARNVHAAARSFRVCEQPSIEACRAQALLGAFLVQSGHAHQAWTLLSAACRMCLDLGLNRLAPPPDGRAGREHRVFWHILLLERGVSLALGRPPSIRPADVSTGRLVHPDDLPGIPGKIYGAFGEVALIQGEMHEALFSASAELRGRGCAQERAHRAGELRARLRIVQTELSRHAQDESILDTPFYDTAKLLEILLFSLLALVCGPTHTGSEALSPQDPNTSRSQQGPHSCVECAEAARQSLSRLVRVGKAVKDVRPKGWARFLNLVLSLAPFTPYLVIASHLISSRHAAHPDDMGLLASVNSVMAPVAPLSPTVHNIVGPCLKLFQLAKAATARGQSLAGRGGAPQLALEADENSGVTLLPGDVVFSDMGSLMWLPPQDQSWPAALGTPVADDQLLDMSALVSMSPPSL